jgi:hypothetical protein
MSSLAERLARPQILALPPFDISANANAFFPADAIRLDANENPYPPLVEGALSADINRYPEPQPARLTAAMAALYGVAPDQLIVTRGADDAIDILIRAFCRRRSTRSPSVRRPSRLMPISPSSRARGWSRRRSGEISTSTPTLSRRVAASPR